MKYNTTFYAKRAFVKIKCTYFSEHILNSIYYSYQSPRLRRLAYNAVKTPCVYTYVPIVLRDGVTSGHATDIVL